MIEIRCLPDLRLYLLSQGFFPTCNDCSKYASGNSDMSLKFEYFVNDRKMIATIPDYRYNSIYPQAKRNMTFTLDVNSFENAQTDIENFMSKVKEIYNRKEIV